MELSSITSLGTTTLLPNIVMEGLSCPLTLNSELFSILAKGLLGFGSSGVPSTLLQFPTEEFHPMTLYSTRVFSPTIEFPKIILSQSLLQPQSSHFSRCSHLDPEQLWGPQMQSHG